MRSVRLMARMGLVALLGFSSLAMGQNSAMDAQVYQDTITFAHAGTINTLNSHVASDMVHNVLYSLVHETLVRYNPNTEELLPSLATAWEWHSDTEIEFSLRDNVYFHNGERFTADDVVYTIESGRQAASNVALFTSTIVSVEALDDQTVRMELAAPNVDFLIRLGNPMLSIINREAAEGDSQRGSFIGTGPWVVAELVESDYVRFIRNDDYWGETPVTRQIVYRTIPEDASRAIALQAGEIDFLLEIGVSQMEYLQSDASIDVVSLPVSSTEYFAFANQKAPGSDLNFRLAVAHALDVDDIIIVAVGEEGTRINSYWGAGTFGLDTLIEPHEYNLELAREYLALTPHRTLEITVNGQKRVNEALVIQHQLRAIGINVTVNEVEQAALVSMTTSGEHQAVIYSLGWGTFGDDARRSYYSTSASNRGNVRNQEVDELLDAALTEFDEEARRGLYSRVQQLNRENTWYIPLYSQNQILAFQVNVGGYELYADKLHDFRYIYRTVR